MKKILFVLNSFSLGGAESISISIINSLVKDYVFGYCCLQGGNIDSYINKSVKRFYLPKINVRNLKKVIQDFNPDIIHANDFTASVCAALSTNKPIISHIHHNSSFIKTINLKTLAYNVCSRKFKKIIFVSESVSNEYVFSKKIKNKQIILPNLIDKERILQLSNEYLPNERFDLLFLGRLESAKNPLRFLKIAEKIKEDNRFKDIIIGMVGQGSLQNACQEYVNSRKISNVIFVGFKDNPYPYLKASKVLCISSDFEGYGLVAEEAKLLKTVVVAHNVGGLCNTLEKTGYLFSTEEEAVLEIKKLLSDVSYYDDRVSLLGEKSLISLPLDKYSNAINMLYTEE